MKLRTRLLVLSASLAVLGGCHSITTPPGHETVLVDNPWFFGHGGVREHTQKPGMEWYWGSTKGVDIATTPVKYDETLDHLPTGDNNFINYASFIVLQWQDPAYHMAKFGDPALWYTHNLKEQYRTIVRDVTKQHSMTDIMTSPKTLETVEKEIARQFRAHIATTGMKVTLINVNMGKALPDAPVVAEMNATAVQQQRLKTEGQRKLAEDGRAKAEAARALADNAYRKEIGLDAVQFIQLESIKRYSHACAESKTGCVIVQGAAPVIVGTK